MAEGWLEHANCRGQGPVAFYPEPKRGLNRAALLAEADAGKAVCAGCVVKAECLAEADKHGTWAGLAEQERRAQRRRLSA